MTNLPYEEAKRIRDAAVAAKAHFVQVKRDAAGAAREATIDIKRAEAAMRKASLLDTIGATDDPGNYLDQLAARGQTNADARAATLEARRQVWVDAAAVVDAMSDDELAALLDEDDDERLMAAELNALVAEALDDEDDGPVVGEWTKASRK